MGAAPLQAFKIAAKFVGEVESTLVVNLTPGRRWRFAVRASYSPFTVGGMSNVAEAVTPTGGALTGHAGMAVAARPQPAASSVTIDWQGDDSGTVPQWLEVYDVNGRLRHRIALGTEPGGRYNWDLKRLMLAHALKFVDRVVLLVGPQNFRSRRAVEKIGGVERGRRIADGRESIVYEISAEAFSNGPLSTPAEAKPQRATRE